VRGFLYYQGGSDTLLKMVHSVLRAELWVSRELMTELLLAGGLQKTPNAEERVPVLTNREVDILLCVKASSRISLKLIGIGESRE
jgi:DNA-binding NarL/FixJ family response regulator